MKRRAVTLLLVLGATLSLNCPSGRPESPAKPWGPAAGRPKLEHTFYAVATSPSGESLCYRFDWGDTTTKTWTSYYAPGETASATHAWPDSGAYGIRVKVRVPDGSTSEWSDAATFIVNDSVNRPPDAPSRPFGPDSVWPFEDHLFRTVLTDVDGDTLSIRVDMGDGDTSHWFGRVASGETTAARLEWYTCGVRLVRFQARDSRGAVSGWSLAKNVYVKGLTGPLWTLDLSSEFSCPAVGSDGTAYVCEYWGGVRAVAPGGTLRWHRPLRASNETSVALASDGMVYFVQDSSGTFPNALRALNSDGSDRWSFRVAKGIRSSPVVGLDRGVHFVCADSFVYSLDAAGTLRWRTRLCSNRFALFEPAIGADGTIYVGVIDSLVALDPDGTVKWSCHLDLPEFAGLAIGSDGTLYGGNPLCAIGPEGSTLWRTDLEVGGAPAIGADGTVYAPTYDGLVALGPDGTAKWTFEAECACSPAVAADGTIYFTSYYMPLLHALDRDGHELWRGVNTSYGEMGGPVALGPDGTIYFAAMDGALCAFAGSSPLADSPWPKFQRDMSNSGRAGP